MFFNCLRPSLGKSSLYVFANMLTYVKNPKHIDYAKSKHSGILKHSKIFRSKREQ